MSSAVWGEISYPFPNLIGAMLGYSQSMLAKETADTP